MSGSVEYIGGLSSRTTGYNEKKHGVNVEIMDPTDSLSQTVSNSQGSSSSASKKERSNGNMHRKLKSRHVQLIAIGGSIGTALFVSIGTGLLRGGPLSLLLAMTFWTFVILLLTTAVGEMVAYMPVTAPFIDMAGRVVDEAFEFTVGWNFFVLEATIIPFEITAVNGMIHFWRDDYSPAIAFCIQIALYGLINFFVVKAYGEAEFWLALGKLVLCIGLLFFTLITMCGGNPLHDAFGFRNWNVAGGPMGEYVTTGALGRFQGFLAALFKAAFVVVGPEYMSMIAGECENPRKVVPTAFRTVLYRLALFYIGGAISVTILVSYKDPYFIEMSAKASNALASPYVIAMKNMGVKVLPHIVNALIITLAFSAGNSYTYCSLRALHSLAKKGFAPKVLVYCNLNGVPIYCVGVAMCFLLLLLMQLGTSGATVFNYLVSLATGSQILNYGFMAITYLRFYHACLAQGIDRSAFAYRSWWQPYLIYFSGILIWVVTFIFGYTVFLPGWWATSDFFFNYLMLILCPILFFGYKFIKKTKFIKSEEADLQTGLAELEEHEYEYYAKLKDEGRNDGNIFSKVMHWVL